MHVVIIGAGWAGLAAAIELSRAGIRVTLIEAAKQAGGRARRIDTQTRSFDNGQHLMLGAYREMLRLFKIINMAEGRAFLRRPLRLSMHSLQEGNHHIEFPKLFAPWHVIAGFARAEGLYWTERYRVLMLCLRLFLSGYKLERDLAVSEWLRLVRQPDRLIKVFWEPLCLATLNTPLHQASAEIFLNVLHEAFAGARSDADLLFPRVDLSSIFPEPALRFIREHGGTTRFSERVTSLAIQNGRIDGVVTRQGIARFDHVIIATSPGECLRLIRPHPLLSDISRQLAMLNYEPICTIYLQYSDAIRLDCTMVGMLGGLGQWIFDLSESNHPGRMAVIISGPGPHMLLDNGALIARIRTEVAQLFPHWPAPTHTLVIREKRATFSCQVGIKAMRPRACTPVQGLWLAGDYTDTNLPATLEGAVRSGVCSAQNIRSHAGILT